MDSTEACLVKCQCFHITTATASSGKLSMGSIWFILYKTKLNQGDFLLDFLFTSCWTTCWTSCWTSCRVHMHTWTCGPPTSNIRDSIFLLEGAVVPFCSSVHQTHRWTGSDPVPTLNKNPDHEGPEETSLEPSPREHAHSSTPDPTKSAQTSLNGFKVV